jgi:hypothetical protein
MQWVPFIKEIRACGVPVIVDLSKGEFNEFMAAMDPEGLFLWVATESERKSWPAPSGREVDWEPGRGCTMEEEVTIEKKRGELGQCRD